MKMKSTIGVLCFATLLAACGGGGSSGGAGAQQAQAPEPTPGTAPGATPAANVFLSGQALQNEVERVRATNGLPGLAVVTVANGRIEAVAAGVRVAGSASALTTTDQMQIASLTKSHTALLIARLVEQGRLRWDSNLGEIFPAWSAAMHPSMRSVTVEQLLRHRAGLKRNADSADLAYLRTRPSGDLNADRATITEYILRSAPAFTPNTRMEYSNLGYMVVALVAEAAGGASYATLMEQEVFGPLQMRVTLGLGEDQSPGAVAGHQLDGGTWGRGLVVGQERETQILQQAGGSIMVSMADYGKFLKAHIDGLQGNSTYLSASTFRMIHTPIDGYAFGWGVGDLDPPVGRFSNHTGAIGTYVSAMIVLHNSGRASAVVCNCDSEAARDVTRFMSLSLASGGL